MNLIRRLHALDEHTVLDTKGSLGSRASDEALACPVWFRFAGTSGAAQFKSRA